MRKAGLKLSRRNFLKGTSAGLAGAIMVPSILSSCAKGINDRILVAHIGVGSRGQHTMKKYFVSLNTAFSVAACDPFEQRRNASADYIKTQYSEEGVKAPKCIAYNHFEEVLERNDIDAVHISTPDHWHLPLAIMAARAGKHIYLEKPLGLSYTQYKTLENELRTHNVRFHYGTQQRSMRHLQLGIEMIKEGRIGEIEKVEVWAPGYNPVDSPVCQEMPVPGDFDYDLWTGPAPLNPYCTDRVTNNSSWFQWDYSIGFLAGWGAHPLDVMIWALKDKLNGKYSCEGTGKYWEPGGMYNNIRAWDLKYEYETGIQVHFFDTDFAIENNLLNYLNLKDSNGTTFYGTNGWISLTRDSAQSNLPELDKKLNDFSRDNNGWIRSEENTMGQLFVDVIKENIKEVCPVEDAILSDCVSHMGNIAIRTGRKVTWNPLSGEVEGDREATSWFVRDMRKPYTV